MKIVIFGANEVGSMIAAEFFEDHDITVMDQDDSKANDFSRLDIAFICGNGADIKALKKARIEDTDIFIACSGIDEANIVACLSVKQLSEAKVACFISKSEYVDSLWYIKENTLKHSLLAIDFIIWPEQLLTEEIFRIITVPEALDVENFAQNKARLLEYRIKENSIMQGKKIKDIGFPEEALIVGITREEKLFIPYGETELKLGDKVIFMGTIQALNITAGKFFHEKDKIKSVVIIGGGSVGCMLADLLEKTGIKVKIIEKSEERCEELSSYLKNTLILNGDGTNLELLQEESVDEADVLISVTNNDEKNLLCSLLAKQLGVNRVISRVSKAVTAGLFEKVGVDVALSARQAAIDEITNRLIEVDYDILATVDRGQGEVLEIIIPEEFQDTEIQNLNLPVRAIIAVIKRGNKITIPKGKNLVRSGDSLIIFTKCDDSQEVKDFFKK